MKSEFHDFLTIDIIHLKLATFGLFHVMNSDDLEYMNY